MLTEQFIRNSDNQIKLTLTEDDSAISGTWTQLDIVIGDVITLTRNSDGDGISLDSTTGLLTITPADLLTTEKSNLDLMGVGPYQVQIVVTSVLNDSGVVFGGQGSERLFFHISDKP